MRIFYAFSNEIDNCIRIIFMWFFRIFCSVFPWIFDIFIFRCNLSIISDKKLIFMCFGCDWISGFMCFVFLLCIIYAFYLLIFFPFRSARVMFNRLEIIFAWVCVLQLVMLRFSFIRNESIIIVNKSKEMWSKRKKGLKISFFCVDSREFSHISLPKIQLQS